VIGVNESATFLVRVLLGITLVKIKAGGGGGASTTRLKTSESVCPRSSVTVTVNCVDVRRTVGVPISCPVSEIKFIPLGREFSSAIE
jgi:hypothetical protein